MHLADPAIEAGGKRIFIRGRNSRQGFDSSGAVVACVGLHPRFEMRVSALPTEVGSLKGRQSQVSQRGKRWRRWGRWLGRCGRCGIWSGGHRRAGNGRLRGLMPGSVSEKARNRRAAIAPNAANLIGQGIGALGRFRSLIAKGMRGCLKSFHLGKANRAIEKMLLELLRFNLGQCSLQVGLNVFFGWFPCAVRHFFCPAIEWTLEAVCDGLRTKSITRGLRAASSAERRPGSGAAAQRLRRA